MLFFHCQHVAMTWYSLITTWLIVGALLLPQVSPLSTCNQTCNSNTDCSQQLICSNKTCLDDPHLNGTQLCGTGSTNITSGCNKACVAHTDCPGDLACFSNKCNDDPFLPTHICGPNNGCKLACKTSDNCPGKLVCINKECNDNPGLGTHICGVGRGDNTTSGGPAIAPSGMRDCPMTTPSCLSSPTSSSGILLIYGHIGTWKVVTMLFSGSMSSLCVFLITM